MRTALAILFISSLGAGCSNEIPGETRLPRCEPRSNVDPARLNIDSDARDYAVFDPCRAEIVFYISHNTGLRTLKGQIGFRHFEGGRVASEPFELEFPAAEAGMLIESVEPAPIQGHMCREFLVHISALTCLDEAGREFDCPEVRLKTSYVFEDFTIETDDLDVCFD